MASATIPALFGRSAKTPLASPPSRFRPTPLTRDKTHGLQQPISKEIRLAEAHMSPEEPKSQTQVQGDRTAAIAEQKALADLAVRCLAGDGQAWEQLAKSQHRRIYGICYRFTGSQSDAEDLSQEAFLKMYKNLASFDPEKGSFTTWLTTLTRNLLVDNYRRSRLERVSDSLDEGYEGEEDGPTKAERLTDGGKSQEQHVSGLELKAQIQEALKQVSPDLAGSGDFA